MNSIAFLEKMFHEVPGPWTIGEVEIRPGFELLHRDDSAWKPPLLASLHELMEWVKLDSSGKYRPLRAAPNLRRGWRYAAGTVTELREALKVIYPSSVAYAALQAEQRLESVPFQQTAERQTGMYHCTRLLSEKSVANLAAEHCEKGCLKRRLWQPAVSVMKGSPSRNEIPLLCVEACNYFVAKAREQVKEKNEAG